MQNIPEENIIFLDLDSKTYKLIKKPEQLEEVLEASGLVKGIKHLFIDEIQNVEAFEEVINAFRGEGDYVRGHFRIPQYYQQNFEL